MELKPNRKSVSLNNRKCFNRTFMELKRYTRKVDTLAKARFNRTFMELKLNSSVPS